MTITWDDYDPAKDAFMFGRTPDDTLWVEVYAYPDPSDMRRWQYQVNIWERADYTMGQPLHGISGQGHMEAGKAEAEKYLKKVR